MAWIGPQNSYAREFWSRNIKFQVSYSSIEQGNNSSSLVRIQAQFRFSDDNRFCQIYLLNTQGSLPCTYGFEDANWNRTTDPGARLGTLTITPALMRMIVLNQIRAQLVRIPNFERLQNLLQQRQDHFVYIDVAPYEDGFQYTRMAGNGNCSYHGASFVCRHQLHDDSRPDSVHIDAVFERYSHRLDGSAGQFPRGR